MLWVVNFEETAFAIKEKPPEKQCTVQTPKNVECMYHAILRSLW